jgi:hypothetical protein
MGGVTHADAEHEAARIGFGQGPLSRSHGHRVTSPDVGDPGADDQLPAGAQQQPGVGQRLPPEDLPGPQRAPAQLLQLGDRLPELVGGLDVQLPGPQPDAGQLLDEWRSRGGGLPLPVHGGPPLTPYQA